MATGIFSRVSFPTIFHLERGVSASSEGDGFERKSYLVKAVQEIPKASKQSGRGSAFRRWDYAKAIRLQPICNNRTEKPQHPKA
ncbi:hypothetical protein ACH5RR_019865 [Cinchona calisaya]|uniref:Uncharacterized protein n=1 Tax=Cinchona calisaya TaxID=153742 RepID=A0ABD2ZQK3_9GENT